MKNYKKIKVTKINHYKLLLVINYKTVRLKSHQELNVIRTKRLEV